MHLPESSTGSEIAYLLLSSQPDTVPGTGLKEKMPAGIRLEKQEQPSSRVPRWPVGRGRRSGAEDVRTRLRDEFPGLEF